MKHISHKFNSHIQEIAKSLLKTNITFDEQDEKLHELPNDTDYVIKMQITGESHQGQLILGFPKESAFKLTEATPPPLADGQTHNQQLESALKLFLNAVADQFLQEELLTNEYGKFTFSPSFLWVQQESQPIGITNDQNSISVLRAENIHFYSMISIRKNEPYQLQAELFLQEKQSVIGELAAGIAHEINNPLSAIITYSNLIKKFIATHEKEIQELFPKLPDYIKNINIGAERCQSITKNIQEFSLHKKASFTKVDLNQVVNKTKELVIAYITKKSITLSIDIPADLPSINGDLISLQQVFMNLIMNAVHAVSKGGEIKIMAEKIDENIHIHVIDNGIGIPECLHEKIFNPFFTTKPIGVGTGLGLPIAFHIIKEHNGNISLKSKSDKGTSFLIELPL